MQLDQPIVRFGFQDLKVWEDAIELSMELLDLVGQLETTNQSAFVDLLRDATIKVSNSIVESTATDVLREKKQLLNKAKKGCFEVANILFLLNKRAIISNNRLDYFSKKLKDHSKLIGNYSNSLW